MEKKDEKMLNSVVRKKSGFGVKSYWLDVEKLMEELYKRDNVSEKNRESYRKEIEGLLGDGENYGQRFGLLKYMFKKGIVSEDKKMRGSDIGRKAIESGDVISAKLSGDRIMASYIRELESDWGVVG